MSPSAGSGGPRLKVFVAVAVVTIAIGYLVISSVGKSSAYYMTIGELQSAGAAAENKKIRLSGNVVADSIQWDARQLALSFELTDGAHRIPVSYRGARPDMFRDDAEAIVEGKFVEQSFRASSLFMKCPSKYEDKTTAGSS